MPAASVAPREDSTDETSQLEVTIADPAIPSVVARDDVVLDRRLRDRAGPGDDLVPFGRRRSVAAVAGRGGQRPSGGDAEAGRAVCGEGGRGDHADVSLIGVAGAA